MVIVIWMNDAFFFICYLIESDLIPHSFPICVWVTFLDLVFISFFPPVHWMLCFIFPFYACSLLVYTLFSIVICILKGKGFLKTSSSWEIWGGGNLEKEKRKEGKIILRAFWGWRLRIWGFGKEGIFFRGRKWRSGFLERKKPKLKGEKVISGEEKNKEKGDRDSLRETKKSCAREESFR